MIREIGIVIGICSQAILQSNFAIFSVPRANPRAKGIGWLAFA